MSHWHADSPKGVQGGERKATLHCSKVDNLVVRKSPLRGPDAPTPARIGTGRPKGRSHFSFDGERKVCKRKPAARRLREKALYCPFWRRGSLCRAQRSWPTYAYSRARSELAFFRRQNGRPFSLRCLSPLCSPAVGGGQAYPLQVEIMPVAWRFCSVTNGGSAFPQLAAGRLNPYGFRRFPEDRREPWHGRCHGDLCAMDIGNPTKPASREARRRAAVASQPSCMSPEHPCAPAARSPGCRGSPPA